MYTLCVRACAHACVLLRHTLDSSAAVALGTAGVCVRVRERESEKEKERERERESTRERKSVCVCIYVYISVNKLCVCLVSITDPFAEWDQDTDEWDQSRVWLVLVGSIKL